MKLILLFMAICVAVVFSLFSIGLLVDENKRDVRVNGGAYYDLCRLDNSAEDCMELCFDSLAGTAQARCTERHWELADGRADP